MRQMLATIVFAVLFGGVGQAQITRHAGSVQIQGTGAEALDNAGGAEFGSGNVELIGTDGKINGPLSTTILDDLSAVNLSGFLGDVTGTGGAMVVGDNSHAHTGTTISALDAGDTTTGTFAAARMPNPAGDVTGAFTATVVGDNSHAHTGTTISALDAGDTTTGTFAAARMPNPAGDVTGAFTATVVGDNSHAHTGTTISALDAGDTTTGTFAAARMPNPAGDVTGAFTATVVGDNSHAHTGTTISALDAGDTTTGTFAAARMPNPAGDVTGAFTATVVGDNSHAHTGTTISALGAGDITTGTFAAARMPNPAGDVTGAFTATVVGDNSHAHTGTTISALGAGDTTTGTFANARIAVGNVTQHQGSIDHGSITGLGDDDHTIYGQLTTAETVSGAWIFSEAPEMTDVAPSTPDVQKVYKESIVKAWARMAMSVSGNSCSVTDGYNIASAVRDSPGVCTMTFGTALPNANYGAFCAGDETNNAFSRFCTIVGRSTTTVQTLLKSGGSPHSAIDSSFSILVIGE